MKNLLLPTLMTIALSLMVVACGGGGGGGSSSATSTPTSTTYIAYTTTVTVPNSQGVIHSTGVIPLDANGDGITDLVFLPSTFNTGSNLPAFTITSQTSSAVYGGSNFWNQSFVTGFSKDWWVRDVNNDGKVDLTWVDHGLELSSGFENGNNASLISGGDNFWNYNLLAGGRAFNHGGAMYNQAGSNTPSLLVADFTNSLKLYSPVNSQVSSLSTLSFGSDFNYSQPGAVTTIKMATSGTAIVAASYTKPNPSDASGHFGFYTQAGNVLTEIVANRLTFPSYWNTNNLGAFAMISGDFRGVGYDDIIVLGETVSLNNYIRNVLYLQQQPNGQFTDATTTQLGNVATLINQPDKLVPFDVNRDGYPDLVGFSYKNGSYVNGFGLFLNNGRGGFTSASFGDSSLAGVANVPVFSTNSDGSWKNLIGIYGISTPNTTSVRVTQWRTQQYGN
jgi:hypothetical protein